MLLEIEPQERQERLDVASRCRQIDAARRPAVGLQAQLRGEAGAAEAARLQSLGQSVERRATEEEQRFEIHQRPLAVQTLLELERWLARHQRLRIEPARHGVELVAFAAQSTHHFRRRQAGEFADRAQPPAGEGLGEVEFG